jgi:AcrR family transcriptional regulator
MRDCSGQLSICQEGGGVSDDVHACVWPTGPSDGPERFRGPQRRRERRDAAAHRQRILEVARQLFAEQGIEAVSMHQIAVAAGEGQGTLYRRYANKGDLCTDLLLERYERFGDEIATLLAQTATVPALERLERVLARMVLWLEEQGSMGGTRGVVAGTERREERTEGPCTDADLSQHTAFGTTPWYRWLHSLLAGLLTEAVERGELAALDIPYTADAMLAALHPAVYRFQRHERGFSSERILQGLRHIYIGGVKAASAPVGRADEHPTV